MTWLCRSPSLSCFFLIPLIKCFPHFLSTDFPLLFLVHLSLCSLHSMDLLNTFRIVPMLYWKSISLVVFQDVNFSVWLKEKYFWQKQIHSHAELFCVQFQVYEEIMAQLYKQFHNILKNPLTRINRTAPKRMVSKNSPHYKSVCHNKK